MIFEGDVLSQTVAVAKAHSIEPAALLAVTEVESGGKSMDGGYPCLLFERHVFYRELKKAGKTSQLDQAIAAGLAHPTWQPATQYKDQGTSAKRVAIYERAAFIDKECATRACSWGVFQTMGFLAEELKFVNAQSMLSFMIRGGVASQVECGIREIENKHLGARLNNHDWAGFARVYNGSGYKQNNYDGKMAAAYLRWSRTPLPNNPPKPTPPAPPRPVPPSPSPPAHIGILAIIAAALGTVWTYFVSLSWDKIVVILGIAIMTLITVIMMWRRHFTKTQQPVVEPKPETAVLSNVRSIGD